jgi:hypothetical protein
VSNGQNPIAVADFTKASFSAGLIDGAAASASGRVNMATSPENVLQIATSALNGTGKGWTETFKHS